MPVWSAPGMSVVAFVPSAPRHRLPRPSSHSQWSRLPFGPQRLLVALFCATLRCCDSLRVVTANIHAWRDSEHDDNLERLCALLRSIQPDVLCLNEVLHPFEPPPPSDPYWEAVHSRRGRGIKLQPQSDQAQTCLERLRRALGLEHFTFGAATIQGSFFGDVPFGNAVLSRFPLDRVAHLVMAPEAGDETLGEQERTPEDLEARGLITAEVVLPDGRRIGIGCTHLDHRAEQLRQKQAALVGAAVDAAFGGGGTADVRGAPGVCGRGVAPREPLPHILCGDLNSFDRADLDGEGWEAVRRHYQARGWPPPTPHSLVLRELFSRGFEDSFRLAPMEGRVAMAGLSVETSGLRLPPPTCWTSNPLFRIDWLLLRVPAGCHQSVRVRRHATLTAAPGQADVSDHRPVVLDVDLI